MFLALGSDLADRLPEARFVFPPAMIAWALPAMFAGIVSAGPVITGLTRLRLGDRYRDFVRYQDLVFRIELQKSNSSPTTNFEESEASRRAGVRSRSPASAFSSGGAFGWMSGRFCGPNSGERLRW